MALVGDELIKEKDNQNDEDTPTVVNKDNSSPDSIREVLDDVEAQIDKVREAVLKLSMERDGLVDLLESISGSLNTTTLSDLHKEEVILEVERLRSRAEDVVCKVKTRRTESQVEALKGVEVEMTRLVQTVEREGGGEEGEFMCKGFLAACGGEVVGKIQSCEKFEKMVLGCALEDQKWVRRRLLEMLSHIAEVKKATSANEDMIDVTNEKTDCSNDTKKLGSEEIQPVVPLPKSAQ